MNLKSLIIESMNEADAATPVNPWTNDPVKAAAWEKLSPQMKAKIGRADPTDKIIISAMADGSGWGRAKGINDANPDGTPKVAPQAANPAPATDVAAQNNRIADRRDAEASANPVTQSVPTPAATPTTNNAATREKLAALLDKLEKTGGVATPATTTPATTTPATTTPATTTPATTTPATTTPSKQLLPVNPSVQAFQKEVLSIDPKAFPKFGADGRKGSEVIRAIAKYPKIAQKYKLTQQAANPAPAAATTSAGPADQNVDIMGNIINTGVMPESVNYKDDQILLAIKNIKY